MLILAVLPIKIRDEGYPDKHTVRKTLSCRKCHIADSLIAGEHCDTIFCEIAISKSMYLSDNPIGFHYDLLKKFEKWSGTHIFITPVSNDSTYWSDLLENRTNLLVIGGGRLMIPKEHSDSLITSIDINDDGDMWVSTKRNSEIIETLNYWISAYGRSGEYRNMSARYDRYFNRPRNDLKFISPYDSLVKANSKAIGWDWRLVSAIIKKESNFFMGVESPRGAIGLMQVKQNIADKYGIDNIYDPEQNIYAGTRYMSEISKRIEKKGITGMENVKFTLASFNAGEARIEDCMRFAESLGKNPKIWDEVAEAIPLMQLEENYKGDYIRLGKFRGTETIKYVQDVLSIYDSYREIL